MSKTLVVYGSRPEYLKVKLLAEAIGADTLHIRQHTDIIDFGTPTHSLEIDNHGEEGRHNKIISEICLKSPEIFKNYDRVLVQGDTASVFGAAISAFHLKKEIIHLEAGLRSYDLSQPFPEEGYRQAVSRFATINLCPTQYSAEILRREGAQGKIHVVGNTVLDNLSSVSPYYGDIVLVTVHRNENLTKINEILTEIDTAAAENLNLNFIFPVHPNPIIQEAAAKMKHVFPFPPMDHANLIYFLHQSKFVVSDSGGIFEEASFLSKKTIILRDKTERSEGIMSGHGTLCSVENIRKEIAWHNKGKNHEIFIPCPFGDGKSIPKIKEILENV